MDINIFDFYNRMEKDNIMLSLKECYIRASYFCTSNYGVEMETLNEPSKVKKKSI